MRGRRRVNGARERPQNRGVTKTRPQRLSIAPAPPWADFDPLLPAERRLLRAAASGEIARIGYRRPSWPTSDIEVRAAFLALMARGAGGEGTLVGGGLQIVGAWITGRLDLATATLPLSLWFFRCGFGAVPVFDGAHVRGSLTFSDCALPGLRAEDARVDRELAINAGCHVEGPLRLSRSAVGGDLNCARLRLGRNSVALATPRRMFVADGMRIGGEVNLLGGCDVVGEVRFVAAQIGADLRAGSARLTADIDTAGLRGVALNLDRARVGGTVALDSGFSAAGTVRMCQARIHGDLDCRGAALDAVGDASWGDCGGALRLDRARIGGALILQQLQTPLQGASLADARVGTLSDDADSWGRQHVLDGFAYKRFGPGAPVDASSRLDWLLRQDSTHLQPDHRPDPWHRVIRVLRRMGQAPSAAQVAIGRARHLRRIGHVGRGAPLALRWLVRFGHDAWGLAAGYGHRPLRLLGVVTVVCLLGTAAWWAKAEHGLFG